MNKCIYLNIVLFIAGIHAVQAQTLKNKIDSLPSKQLLEVTIVGRNSTSDYQQMPEIVGTNVYAGKKSTLIVLDNVQGNVVTNTMRQVLAKVPGIHIWESDPSGIQIGIAARGLSANRSWEFNIRQNGYDIAADPFGYPEAYYNPQLQAVQRIEVVRGQGSLQYGPQFGGLVNYILRDGSEFIKPIQIESRQTMGSNGLINLYNAIGGQNNKLHYYAYFDHRSGDGWRKNSQYYTNSGFATLTYTVTPKLTLTSEIMQSHIRSQQPGGLTDAQLQQDAKQSFRSRNWFDITWLTPAFTAKWRPNENTLWNTKFFGTIGNRNSVGYLQPITIQDSINSATLTYNNRLVNLDQYRNFGMESRFLTNYQLGSFKNTLSGGFRLYTGTTSRQADGKGTTGSDYDVSIVGNYPRDIQFQSTNAAAFFEHVFRYKDKILVIPGMRYEWLKGSAAGRNGYTSSGTEVLLQDITRSRSFILLGIGAEYRITSSTAFYTNITQAYRPIQFANLQAPPSTDVVDPNLKDAKGYNFDVGYRGKYKNYLQFDISYYYLRYNNRVGAITPVGLNYRLITNVGASTSKGLETFAEFNVLKAFRRKSDANLLVFGSWSYTNARYSDDHQDASTKGKKVENAPAQIFRGGITGGYKKCLLTVQVSYTGSTYSDANNTEIPSANGNVGLIPSYTISDFTFAYKCTKSISIKAGINNVLDARYFTRRAGGYPGPGALPADGRTCFIALGASF